MENNEKLIFDSSTYEIKEVDRDILWKKIYKILEKILKNEFSSEEKRRPVLHDDRISFACVYCGDSHKDERKKRGNIYMKNMMYHCFNGECSVHKSVYDFFKDMNRLDEFTTEELVFLKESKESGNIDISRLKSSMGLETYFSNEISDLSVSKEGIKKAFGLVDVKGSDVEAYMKKRYQFDFEKFLWDPRRKRLFLFNLDSTKENVIGLQIKTFEKSTPYLTWKISKIHEIMGIYDPENEEQLKRMDVLSTMFGIFHVDFDKPVTIFEGPLDSFLYPNSLGICSAKNSVPFDIEGSRYFYDNDETGREWSIRRLNEGKSVFLWKKFLEESDLNHPDIKIKDLTDLFVYVGKTRKKCKKISDYFSDSKYDGYFI